MKQILIFIGLMFFHAIANAEPPAWTPAATAVNNTGNYRQLEKNYRRALKAEPNNHKMKLALARSYETQGRLQESLKLAQQLRENGVANVDTFLLIGRLEGRTNNWQAARDSYQHAIQLEPKNAGAHLGLGQALEQLGDEEGATREYDQYQSMVKFK